MSNEIEPLVIDPEDYPDGWIELGRLGFRVWRSFALLEKLGQAAIDAPPKNGEWVEVMSPKNGEWYLQVVPRIGA